MPLDASDRREIERWSYPVPSDTTDVEEQLARLGAPEVVALERLQILRGEMIATPGNRTFGDDRLDHTTNLPWLLDLIERVVAYLNSGDLTLNPAAEDLLLVEQTGTNYTESIDMVVRNPRRAG